MMVGGWAPVMSNTILEILMLDEKYLGKEYKVIINLLFIFYFQDGVIKDAKAEGNWKFENVEIPNTGKYTIFAVKVGKSLVIDGLT